MFAHLRVRDSLRALGDQRGHLRDVAGFGIEKDEDAVHGKPFNGLA
jgi:hypothetical protein